MMHLSFFDRKKHLMGSLQHAPHIRHLPFLPRDTGRSDSMLLLSFLSILVYVIDSFL